MKDDGMEPVNDVACLGHIELNTPKIDETLWFFTELMGMSETAHEGPSVYLRCFGELERTTVKLTEAELPGIAHIGWRAASPAALERRAAALERSGRGEGWIDGDIGHGRAYRFRDPDGHLMELYWDTERHRASDETRSRYRNQGSRHPTTGVGVRRLDHLHLLCNDVPENREFMREQLGFKLRENVVLDDGTESSAWISVTPLVHDVAYSLDALCGRARLHHAGFAADNREDLLRAADIFLDNGIFIESGPSKHKISHQFFLYVYEPGGNRIEIVSGGYLIFAPDWEPITWTEAERRDGQAWGLRLPKSFHSYGTPPVDEPVETREIPVVEPI
jgi:catechol 2,3-dioxygenase